MKRRQKKNNLETALRGASQQNTSQNIQISRKYLQGTTLRTVLPARENGLLQFLWKLQL